MSIFCQKRAQNSIHKIKVFRQNKNPKTLVNTRALKNHSFFEKLWFFVYKYSDET